MLKFLVLASLLWCSQLALQAQTTYNWSGYPTRCVGAAVYTQPNMTVTVTGTAFANYGPQSPSSACAASGAQRYFSPKYVSSPNASAPDWQFTGLGLGVDWANTSSNAVVTIDFTTPVCGPLQFSIYDINSGTWGGYSPTWRDRVTISGTNAALATIYPSSISACSNNTISGANSNVINAGINTGCTNATQTITFNSPTIKSLTITYNSLGLDPTYGTDPDPEYIIIGSITSTGCIILPTSMADLRVECTSLGPKIQWESTSEAENANFEVLGSMDAIAFTPLGKVEAENRRAEWTDQEGIVQFYRLRRTLANGDSEESAVVPAPFGCAPNGTLELFPNPSRGRLSVVAKLPGSGEAVFEVFDACGRKVAPKLLSSSQNSGEFRQELDLSDWPAGIYLVKCSGSDKVLNRHFLLTH